MKRMTRCGRGNNKGFLPTAAAGTAELVYEGMLRICICTEMNFGFRVIFLYGLDPQLRNRMK